MSNPVSDIPSAALPHPTMQVVDPTTGLSTGLFHRFLTGMWQRTGGAIGANSLDVQAVSTQALGAANSAQATATLATSNAATAQATANQAVSNANTANNNAVSALGGIASIQQTALFAINNLSDVSSLAAARENLGVSVVPVTVYVESTQTHGTPLVIAATVPLNLAGTAVYWTTAPAVNLTLTVRYKRGNVLTLIGTILINAGGTGFNFSAQPAVNLNAGDALVVSCLADASVSGLAITFAMNH